MPTKKLPGMLLSCCLFSCSLLLTAPCPASEPSDPPPASGIVVHASKAGDDIVTDVSFVVDAPQKEVWSVLIDFDHMPEFLDNVRESRIVNKHGNKITVQQSGKVTFGPFFSSFETTREIDLTPMREIRSRVVAGNIKKADSLTTLVPEAGRTKVVYHNASTPNIHIPFDIGKGAIEKQVRKQFEEFKAEILKRAKSD